MARPCPNSASIAVSARCRQTGKGWGRSHNRAGSGRQFTAITATAGAGFPGSVARIRSETAVWSNQGQNAAKTGWCQSTANRPQNTAGSTAHSHFRDCQEKAICTLIARLRSDARSNAITASDNGSVWVIRGFTSISRFCISPTATAYSP